MPDLPALATSLAPSVAGLTTRGGGSGVLIAPGRVLTLARNLPPDADADGLGVVLGGGEPVAASVLGRDAAADVAVLALDGDAGAPALAWADDPATDAVAIGTPVVALGDPGGRGLRVTPGVVASAPRGVRGPRGRLVDGVLEHTAPLPRGSGGGPLVDADGALLGLNAVRRPGGFILAWPAAALRPAVDAILAGTHRPPRLLGVAVASPRVARRLRAAVGLPAVDGLLVQDVRAGAPADAAGIARGDLLVAAAGRALTGMDDLHAALDAADGTLELELLRGADRRAVTVTLDPEGAAA